MIEDSRRMKGILQMYDVDANIGYDRAVQDARDRSRSLGRDLSAGARSERNVTASPLIQRGKLGASLPADSQPALLNIRNEGEAKRFNESFQTEKPNGVI